MLNNCGSVNPSINTPSPRCFTGDKRIGFLGPLVLGGIIGGVLTAYFYNRPLFQSPYSCQPRQYY